MHFRFEHDFDIDPKDYWELFFSDDYNEELYQRLKMSSRHVIELKDDGKTIRRVQKLTPNMEVPKVFQSVVKDSSYTEYDLYQRDRSRMEVTIEPQLMKNKFDFKAVYAVAEAGPGRCRRTFEGDVKISVMIIGGQLEKYMVDTLRSSYDTATDVTRKFIAQRKAARSA